MGVFTVLRQAQVTINLGPPPWWLSGAAVDLDLDNFRYYDSSLGAGGNPSLGSYLSCTRASTGYAKKVDGSLISFGNNVLRCTDLGLLIEDARTNLWLNSTDISLENLGAVTVSSSGVAPDWTVSQKVTETTANGQHTFNSPSVTAAAGYYTLSIFGAPAGRTALMMQIIDNAGSNVTINADFSTGTMFGQNVGGSNLTNVSGVIEQFKGGWWRASLILNMVSATGTNPLGYFYLLNASNSFSYAGDGTSGLLIWGPQFEIGSFASSYIPTTTASVTRAADVIAAAGNLNTVLSAIPESVYVESYGIHASTLTSSGLVTDGSSSSFIATFDDTHVESYKTGFHLAALLGGGAVFSAGGLIKSAFGQASGVRSIVSNAGTVATDANSFTPVSPAYVGTVNGGSGSGYSPNGYIRRIAAWNSKLSDSTLQSLTV